MKNTIPLNLPFPECNTPVTEDASDIVQLANLAVTVDDAVQDRFTIADDNLLSPDACGIAAAGQTVADGDFITFSIVRVDNTGGAMAFSEGIRTRISGTYMVSFWLSTTAPTGSQNGKGIITLDGVGDRLFEGLGGYSGTIPIVSGNNMSGSVIFRSPADRLYRLKPKLGSGTAPVTILTAEFAAVRLGPI